jgi:hypothetical protein
MGIIFWDLFLAFHIACDRSKKKLYLFIYLKRSLDSQLAMTEIDKTLLELCGTISVV